ncbi:protoporphyrinogen oxidase [Streptomyces sp. NPDC088725]|uniref:protoporphyrinogen oxidase n=1 Tax=Streptomyces sp. NPDC088725 TaxID=3365873 RepID=UPI00381B56A8
MEPSTQHADTHTGHVVVIGGGVAGLAAAHRLLSAGIRVTLIEATDRLGGKLRSGEIEGVQVDLGAESMLARRPEGVELARAAGLGDLIRSPTTASASLWNRGELRPMPKGHVMGVPGDPAALAGVLSADGLARAAREPEIGPTEVGDDIAVGAYVAERLGREVVDRLVEPLLGGVYAGDAYRISMKAAVPQLFEAVRTHDSLLAAVQGIQAKAAAQQDRQAAEYRAAGRLQQTGGPVFAGIEGGLGRLPGAVADSVRAAGGEILMETPVRGLTRAEDGWRIRTDERVLAADGIVLATPAPAASALLSEESPTASAELAGVEYASMALVTMAFRRADLDAMPEGSGFLVPPVDGHTIKAATFSTRKWGWVSDAAPGLFVLRTSVGRYGEEEHLGREDADLVDVSLSDLGAATGLAAKPVATEVTRWSGALPQYPVGHLARVARVREAVAKLPGLRVCGAAYDGVGIPACVASARRAADEIIATSTLAKGTGRGAGE